MIVLIIIITTHIITVIIVMIDINVEIILLVFVVWIAWLIIIYQWLWLVYTLFSDNGASEILQCYVKFLFLQFGLHAAIYSPTRVYFGYNADRCYYNIVLSQYLFFRISFGLNLEVQHARVVPYGISAIREIIIINLGYFIYVISKF